MAAQVSLPDLTGLARATENRTVERNLQTGTNTYSNDLKIKENRFADLYFDKMSERQQQASVQRRQDDLLSRTESLTRSESNTAEPPRMRERSHAVDDNRDEKHSDTMAKNGEKLPGEDVKQQDSLKQDSSSQESAVDEKAGHSKDEVASDSKQKHNSDAPENDENGTGDVVADGNDSADGEGKYLSAGDQANSNESENGEVLLASSFGLSVESPSGFEKKSGNDQDGTLAESTDTTLELSSGVKAGVLNGEQLSSSAMANTSSQELTDASSQKVAQTSSQQLAESDTSILSGKLLDSEGQVVSRSSLLPDKAVSEGEAEVTQRFKELGAKLQDTGQQPGTSEKLNLALAGLEKPEMLRSGAVETTLLDKALATDKTAVGVAQTAAVRSSLPSTMPQSAYVTNLQMPVRSPEWQNGMAQKLVWFVSEKIQSAKIHVSPPELGPVDLKIQVSKDQAQIQVQSPHAVVRDMLEGTAQRLREMMASQGIDLTSFDVGPQQQQSDNGGSATTEEHRHDGMAGTAAEGDQAAGEENLELNQLVDYYV